MRRHLTLILTLILAVAALVLPGAANAGYSPFRISTVSISHDKLHLTLFFPRAGRVDAHPVQPAQQFQQGEARQPRGQRPARTACSRSRNVERSAGHTYPRTLCRDRHTTAAEGHLQPEDGRHLGRIGLLHRAPPRQGHRNYAHSSHRLL